MADMARLGARSLPVVSRGDKFLIAQSLGKLAEFLGLNEQIKPKLSPDELAARIDKINRGAQRFISQIPTDRFEDKLRNRDRPYRVLCHHVFRIPEAIVDAMSAGIEGPHENLVHPPPHAMKTPAHGGAHTEPRRQK